MTVCESIKVMPHLPPTGNKWGLDLNLLPYLGDLDRSLRDHLMHALGQRSIKDHMISAHTLPSNTYTVTSRAPLPSLKEVGNQAYPQFCSGLLRNSIMNIIHSMWVLTNSDEYHLLKWVLASRPSPLSQSNVCKIHMWYS